jgi:hypothetical protein
MNNQYNDVVYVTKVRRYTRGWKLLELHGIHEDFRPEDWIDWKNLLWGFFRPEDWIDWKNLLWGFDIWYGPVPVGKSIVLANLIMWALMWLALR